MARLLVSAVWCQELPLPHMVGEMLSQHQARLDSLHLSAWVCGQSKEGTHRLRAQEMSKVFFVFFSQSMCICQYNVDQVEVKKWPNISRKSAGYPGYPSIHQWVCLSSTPRFHGLSSCSPYFTFGPLVLSFQGYPRRQVHIQRHPMLGEIPILDG